MEGQTPKNRRNTILRFIFFLFVVIIIVEIGFFLFLKYKKTLSIKKGGTTPAPSSQNAAVELQTEYKNPLDEKTQYVNPFSEYKNPFDNLK